MDKDRFFLDTVFIQAILNQRDQYYSQALKLLPCVKNAREVWLTEAILMEVGNALSWLNRQKVINFIRQCYKTDNMKVVNITPELFNRGLNLYESRLAFPTGSPALSRTWERRDESRVNRWVQYPED